ncbi:unnamed protein product [Albugo candida]|uniref:Uncharacterized protein n=1 Tax=Albugo candida TaxID=65357 RepID=A0A024GBD6_9STRA|nr:unnamed protein product [Albugo candida]|eukprot:CCI44078.1 unnamed protein product [Albugo candida]
MIHLTYTVCNSILFDWPNYYEIPLQIDYHSLQYICLNKIYIFTKVDPLSLIFLFKKSSANPSNIEKRDTGCYSDSETRADNEVELKRIQKPVRYIGNTERSQGQQIDLTSSFFKNTRLSENW